MASSDDDRPRFDPPSRPERQFGGGGVEHVGETVFALQPEGDLDVDTALSAVLEADRYVVGDWYDFPRPVYLVRDHEVGTAFRVLVRPDRVDCHLLPDTDTAAVAALYDALDARTAGDWTVDCEVREP